MSKKKGMWKPVTLNSALLNSGVEGLIGIEECTDYTIIKRDKSVKRKLPEKKVKSTKKPKLSKIKCEDTACESFSPSNEGSTSINGSSCQSNGEDFEEPRNISAWQHYNLPLPILKALSELNFIQPTEIQAQTLPAAILGRRDILGAAETGSGKTLAFGLPILTGILKIKEKQEREQNNESDDDISDEENDLLEESGDTGCVKVIDKIKSTSKPLFALILTPTRELAIQVKEHLKAVAKYTGIQIATVVGGMAAVKQERLLSRGPEIVVATPGRLWQLIQLGNEHLTQVDNIRFLAIDETDRMLEKGHFQELHDLLERVNLNANKRKLRQNFVFSATLTLVHDLPKHLVNRAKIKGSRRLKEMTSSQKLQKIIKILGITNPKIVDITQGIGISETLTEYKILCRLEDKDYYVYYFLHRNPGRTLIFCNSIGCVKRLAHLLQVLQCNAWPLHSLMQQRQRLKNLDRFKQNECSVLIATDVAARGLDVPNVNHVLHYQTPRTSENYVHRSGRTARASKEGTTVLLMEPKELGSYLKLCKTLKKSQDLPKYPIEESYLKAIKDRVYLARSIEKLEYKSQKENAEKEWLKKAAREADLYCSDDDKNSDSDTEYVSSKNKKSLDLQRKQLKSLLSRPITTSMNNRKYSR